MSDRDPGVRGGGAACSVMQKWEVEGFTLRDSAPGVPPLRRGCGQHETEDWDKRGGEWARVAEGKSEVHPGLSISRGGREKWGCVA